MKTIFIFSVCMILFILTSCEWFEPSAAVDMNSVVVFKYRDIDYSNNIWIGIMNDEDYMRPGRYDTLWPIKLDSGYMVCIDCAVKGTAYLSITITEYKNIYDNWRWPDSLNHCCIIEKEPFSEFYFRNDINPIEIRNGTGFHGMDTAKLNRIIREGKLEDYFTKQL